MRCSLFIGPAVIVLLAAAWSDAQSLQQDVVVLSSGVPDRDGQRMTGEILDYTGRELRIRLFSGREAVIPADRVRRIETQWITEHVTGDAMWEQGKFDEALGQYRTALSKESRLWVRRKILAEMVWCLSASGRIEPAAEQFLNLLHSDPTTQFFDAVPLAWSPQQPSPALERSARRWMAAAEQPAAALIGASWLLSTGDRARAVSTLKQLAGSADRRVAQLAAAQLWRTQIVTATADEVAGWQRATEQMPGSLRAGPYFLLGKAMARLGRHEQAVLALMHVPILYGKSRSLAAEALLCAAEQLGKVARRQEALGLYREIVDNYPETRAAAEAKGLQQNTDGS